MTSWRDQLQPASFKKVPFFVDSREYQFGRKNIFHDFPFRDDSEVEDQGQATGVFSVTGYVLSHRTGLDVSDFSYMQSRNNLIAVLESEGAGKYVDRYGLGERNVALQGMAKMSETSKEGGIARFQMTFKVVGIAVPPDIVIDPKASMDIVSLESSNILLDYFNAVMDIAADLQKLSNDITTAMQGIISKIRQLKDLPGSVISTATGMVLATITLVDSVLNLPGDLAEAVAGSFDSFLFAAGMLDDTISRAITGDVSGRVENPEDAERNSDELSQEEGMALAIAVSGISTFGSDLPTINVVSSASAADQANRQANINLTRAQALITACRIAVRTTFKSQDDALALLLILTNAIDDFLDYLGEEAGDETLAEQGIVYTNDQIYTSVKQLKPALKKAFDIIGADLAKIINYEVGNTVISTLTLAYDRYEDLDRSQEITDRNAALILNPCFIPNGKTINILSK